MINEARILGRLGADPEIRYTNTGTAVASFNVATTERWKGQDGLQDKTEWHKCTAWGKTGELISEHFSKGMRIYCQGRIETRKWQDQQNNDRYTTEIIVKEFKFVDPKNQSGQSEPEPPPGYGGTGEDVPF